MGIRIASLVRRCVRGGILALAVIASGLSVSGMTDSAMAQEAAPYNSGDPNVTPDMSLYAVMDYLAKSSYETSLKPQMETVNLVVMVMLGVLVAGGLGGLALLSAMAPLSVDLTRRPIFLRVAGRTYDVHSAAGIVGGMPAVDRTTHHVAGTETRDGHGNLISSTAGYSYTVTDQGLVLLDKDGQHHSFNLRNWGIVALPGHFMSVIWPIQRGKERGSYVAVQNYTTRKLLRDIPAINAMGKIGHGPRFLVFLGMLAATGLVILFMPGAGAMLSDQRAEAAAMNTIGTLLVAAWVGKNILIILRETMLKRALRETVIPDMVDALGADAPVLVTTGAQGAFVASAADPSTGISAG